MDFEAGWEGRWIRENGALLRERRVELYVSQRILADAAGLNVSQVSRVEAGRDARLSTWIKLYRGLGYEVVGFEIVEIAEDCGGLLEDEARRREERRDAGLLMGKRWR